MPDPRKLIRRIGQSNLPSRLVAHAIVVSLVLAASVGAVASANGTDGAGPGFVSSIVVSPVRGAAAPTAEPTSVELDVTPSVGGVPAAENGGSLPSILLDRGTAAVIPGHEAQPTPVAVDPNATPLAAPTAPSVGSITAQTAPTVRVAAPIPTNGALVWPVPGGTISQYYHAGHLALDIAAPYGSAIVAAKAGTVTWSGWRNNGGGNVIVVDHGGGLQTVYNHLGSLWVGAGAYVVAGQAIGGVGCTGMCTGPHVHFEVIANGVIDNPLRYL